MADTTRVDPPSCESRTSARARARQSNGYLVPSIVSHPLWCVWGLLQHPATTVLPPGNVPVAEYSTQSAYVNSPLAPIRSQLFRELGACPLYPAICCSPAKPSSSRPNYNGNRRSPPVSGQHWATRLQFLPCPDLPTPRPRNPTTLTRLSAAQSIS